MSKLVADKYYINGFTFELRTLSKTGSYIVIDGHAVDAADDLWVMV